MPKTNYSNFSNSSFYMWLFVFLKEFLHKFDVFIGHICYGVGVGAVEVDEPGLRDYFCCLGLDGLEVALAEPAIDGVIGIACGGNNLLHG